MKTPKQLRDDIQTLSTHLRQVEDALLKRADIKIAQIGKECKRSADAIGQLLKDQQLPDDYKVAVVGRFKVGKSSFVNELLGEQLATEETNPETAAITTFRQGDQIKAVVRFIGKEEWIKLQELYSEDPKHMGASRVKKWNSFSVPEKAREGESKVVFDLSLLENQFIKTGGFTKEIILAPNKTKKTVKEFRSELKNFTSGARPHHCLVQEIEITVPAAILDGGVLLTDTPGLDDTERYRVGLTEEIVKKVDVVLFLTKSGGSYNQQEKDFLVSLLRNGSVKQLIVVVTQVDHTYEQHVRVARDNDDEPESIASRIELERNRIAKEIDATLNELCQDDSSAMHRYREQLGNVEIVFTSAIFHRDWKAGKLVTSAIRDDDPGGIELLKNQLLSLLSTESRLALTSNGISNGAKTILLDLQSVLEAKLMAIRVIKDKEVAEQRLRTFRDKFGEASERFEGAVKRDVKLLSDRLIEKRNRHQVLMENIVLLAEQQLHAFELNDSGRHWRTKRSGNWGYMSQFQTTVANKIFPKVTQLLNEYTESFSTFSKDFSHHLKCLSQESEKISDEIELSSTRTFDVSANLNKSLEKSLQQAHELIVSEELRVNKMLDNFVHDEVSDRISEQREKVSSIWGAGTTSKQSVEVREFYNVVKALLAEALLTHLKARGKEFSEFLLKEAETTPRDALKEVFLLLEQAADNIRDAAEAEIAGQKQKIELLVAEIKQEYAETLNRADQPVLTEHLAIDKSMKPEMFPMLDTKVTSKQCITKHAISPITAQSINVNFDAENWIQRVQREATVGLKRMRLQDGATGWSFEKIFDVRFLEGALRVTLIDPYLAAHHQIRNLKEFMLHVAELIRPKDIEIITSNAPIEFAEHQQRIIDDAAKDLFQNFGVTLTVQREDGLHDRSLVLDHGVLFKLGRGLDIYKPATGLAAHRQVSRRVRETDIDIFVTPNHALDQK